MNSLGLGLNESKSQSRFMRKESRKDIPVKVQDQLANQEEFKSNQKEYLSVQRYNTQQGTYEQNTRHYRHLDLETKLKLSHSNSIASLT